MKNLIITLLLSTLSLSTILSQDLETEIELLYKKNADQSAVLISELKDEDGEALSDAQLLYFTVSDTLKIELGKVQTDQNGNGLLVINDINKVFASADHTADFKVVYEGAEGYEASETDLVIKDAIFKMELEVVDSVNTVSFQLSSWDEDGELIGVEDGEIYLYVPRLFGQLQTGEAWTDEDGQDQTKFPLDIPGDKDGMITVIARIDEHEEFGTLEISQDIAWGVPLVEENGSSRSLVSSKTPLWMLISFIILMVAVWFHYGVILMKLRNIKSIGKDEEELIFD